MALECEKRVTFMRIRDSDTKSNFTAIIFSCFFICYKRAVWDKQYTTKLVIDGILYRYICIGLKNGCQIRDQRYQKSLGRAI